MNSNYTAPTVAAGVAMNTLHYDDVKQGRSLHVSITNEAASSLGDTIGMFVVGRYIEKTGARVKRLSLDNQPALPGLSSSEVLDVEETATNEVNAVSASLDPQRQQIRTIFRCKNDILELDEPRLKASNKLDYARRLTYLFLYGHGIEGRDEVPKASLVDILNKAKVYDTNTAKWIRNTTSLKIEDDKVRLNKEGKENASAILKALLDNSVNGTWMPDQTNNRTQKSSQQSIQKSPSSGKRSSLDTKIIVAKWKSDVGSSVDTHNKLNSAKLLEKGLFALWAMSRIGGDLCKVVSAHTLTKFLLDAVVIQVSVRNLGRALESAEAKGKVIKVPGGYQIQPPGSNHIEHLLGLEKPKSKSK